MAKKDLYAELEAAIAEMELTQQREKIALRRQFREVVNGFNPVTLIKDVLQEVTSAGNIKGNIINIVLGVSAGYLSKWIVETAPKNKFRKILGSIVMFGISNLISTKLDRH